MVNCITRAFRRESPTRNTIVDLLQSKRERKGDRDGIIEGGGRQEDPSTINYLCIKQNVGIGKWHSHHNDLTSSLQKCPKHACKKPSNLLITGLLHRLARFWRLYVLFWASYVSFPTLKWHFAQPDFKGSVDSKNLISDEKITGYLIREQENEDM